MSRVEEWILCPDLHILLKDHQWSALVPWSDWSLGLQRPSKLQRDRSPQRGQSLKYPETPCLRTEGVGSTSRHDQFRLLCWASRAQLRSSLIKPNRHRVRPGQNQLLTRSKSTFFGPHWMFIRCQINLFFLFHKNSFFGTAVITNNMPDPRHMIWCANTYPTLRPITQCRVPLPTSLWVGIGCITLLHTHT